MSRIKNFYTVSPQDLKPGDVLVATVTLHVQHHADEVGAPYFRMYRWCWAVFMRRYAAIMRAVPAVRIAW